MTVLLANADAVRIPLADESVDCVVTSPPYWSLRKYAGQQERIWGGDPDCRHSWGDSGEIAVGRNNDETPEELQRRFEQGHRRSAGSKATNNNPRNASSGRYCSKCSAWKGSLGLEPSPSEFVSHLVEVFREVQRVLKASGCVFINIGDSYAGSWGNYAPGGIKGKQRQQTEEGKRWERKAYGDTTFLPPSANISGLKAKDLCLIPARLSLALQKDGWWIRSEITICKVAPMPESVTDRPTSATEKVFLLTKNSRYYYDAEAVRMPAAKSSLARIAQPNFKNQTGGPKDYGHGTNANRSARRALENFAKNPGHNLWNYWLLSPEPWKGSHFAVFPTALPDICIRAGSSEHGVCAECGAPWQRVTEKGLTAHDGRTESAYPKGSTAHRMSLLRQAARERGGEYANTTRTIGWEPTCTCSTNEVTPAVVLDPFVGSGSTLIAARRLGRQGIGLDLSFPYLRDQARPRLELDRLADWGTGREVKSELDGLPLFEAKF